MVPGRSLFGEDTHSSFGPRASEDALTELPNRCFSACLAATATAMDGLFGNCISLPCSVLSDALYIN